jgi:hypothetical protein
MRESVVDQLDGPAREKEEEKIAGRRPGLWLSSVVIRVLLLLSLPDLGGSSSTTNRLPNLRELIPIKAIYKSSPTNPPWPPTTRAASLNILRLSVHHNRNPPPPITFFIFFFRNILVFLNEKTKTKSFLFLVCPSFSPL